MTVGYSSLIPIVYELHVATCQKKPSVTSAENEAGVVFDCRLCEPSVTRTDRISDKGVLTDTKRISSACR